VQFRGGFAPSEALAACASLVKAASASQKLPDRLFALDEPDSSGPESLTAVGKNTRLETRKNLRAGLILAEEGVSELPESVPVLRVTNARQAIRAIILALAERIERPAPFVSGVGNSIHPSAIVEGVLEGGVTVGAGAYVGAGSFVGRGTHIEPNATIQEHCRIGRHCVIQSGAVIGCTGFGFLDDLGGASETMPHLAGVEIGDACFIGANTVVAAGVLHPTEVGNGCKLDSHVQIAHNVRLGKNCLMASQSGIAGSTVVGDYFRMGGAASVAGHLRIGNNVSLAAKSGVTKDIPDGSVVAGFPAQPIREWRKRQVFLRNSDSYPEKEVS
jgi:UDP-3-O-[3-hydroxymyristoyl] glucosamine N-acyltransferase